MQRYIFYSINFSYSFICLFLWFLTVQIWERGSRFTDNGAKMNYQEFLRSEAPLRTLFAFSLFLYDAFLRHSNSLNDKLVYTRYQNHNFCVEYFFPFCLSLLWTVCPYIMQDFVLNVHIQKKYSAYIKIRELLCSFISTCRLSWP